MSKPISILIVDSEEFIREGCKRAVAGEDREVKTAGNAAEGLELLKSETFDIVLLDLMLPDVDGLSVLKWIKRNRPEVQAIAMTGFATVPRAVEAMKEGAFDFVAKPFMPDHMRIMVQRAVDKRSLLNEAHRLREEKVADLYTIAQEQSRLKTVMSCMEGAILVTNRDGKVVLHNPAAVSVLKLPSEPVIGKHVSKVILNQDAVKMIDDVVSNLTAITREFEPGTVSPLFLRACCAPVRTATGKIFGSVTVFEDVSTQKRIDQLKSELISMVAHELRAPLASIEQLVHAARSCLSDDQRREQFLSHIQERTKGLLHMIGNMLNLSRLDSGAVEFKMEPVRGNELLGEVVKIMRPRANSERIGLDLESPKTEWWIYADHEQIRNAFTNIIDNALKYTRPGGRVTVSTNLGNGLVVVQCADSGIGIEPEHLPHIFDRFFRVKDKSTRGITGTGLGLPLVKRIIEAHKGRIDVHSEQGRGTTFTISLPLADSPRSVQEG